MAKEDRIRIRFAVELVEESFDWPSECCNAIIFLKTMLSDALFLDLVGTTYVCEDC